MQSLFWLSDLAYCQTVLYKSPSQIHSAPYMFFKASATNTRSLQHFVFISFHSFHMGFRSGLCADHSINSTTEEIAIPNIFLDSEINF